MRITPGPGSTRRLAKRQARQGTSSLRTASEGRLTRSTFESSQVSRWNTQSPCTTLCRNRMVEPFFFSFFSKQGEWWWGGVCGRMSGGGRGAQARGVRSTSPAANPSNNTAATGVAGAAAAEVMSLRSIITLLITWMTPFVACTSGRTTTASRPSHSRWILPETSKKKRNKKQRNARSTRYAFLFAGDRHT